LKPSVELASGGREPPEFCLKLGGLTPPARQVSGIISTQQEDKSAAKKHRRHKKELTRSQSHRFQPSLFFVIFVLLCGDVVFV
jgi:hypothetical protein